MVNVLILFWLPSLVFLLRLQILQVKDYELLRPFFEHGLPTSS